MTIYQIMLKNVAIDNCGMSESEIQCAIVSYLSAGLNTRNVISIAQFT